MKLENNNNWSSG